MSKCSNTFLGGHAPINLCLSVCLFQKMCVFPSHPTCVQKYFKQWWYAFFFVIGHMIVTIMITCLRLTKSWTSLGWAWPSSGHLGYEFKQLLSSIWFKLLFVNQIKRDKFFMLIYRLIFKFINRINHLQSTGQSKSG